MWYAVDMTTDVKRKKTSRGTRVVVHTGTSTGGKPADLKYTITVVRESIFRSRVVTVADYICALTRHKFCGAFDSIWNWSFEAETTLYKTEVDRDTARSISDLDGIWLDDDEDDT